MPKSWANAHMPNKKTLHSHPPNHHFAYASFKRRKLKNIMWPYRKKTADTLEIRFSYKNIMFNSQYQAFHFEKAVQPTRTPPPSHAPQPPFQWSEKNKLFILSVLAAVLHTAAKPY